LQELHGGGWNVKTFVFSHCRVDLIFLGRGNGFIKLMQLLLILKAHWFALVTFFYQQIETSSESNVAILNGSWLVRKLNVKKFRKG